jgi:hypothetical protein
MGALDSRNSPTLSGKKIRRNQYKEILPWLAALKDVLLCDEKK